eukprot:CAMPEP_0181231490 /NCGR_PEP_ID=MMETSP1096-20121128/35136_1 /TAXON_ID=156174 ORGANISM="Chrysochromulina ericina, Strain CCMP281" /NCGR_SAMPLE_ID=MMETSP1096 /ASSEMBLY_ACC=CAM_ASM_000453 /LENGTH=91 /DNA_ID=CAMNT_0023325539 /DNA_START=1 /DNA_END=275 /DNA_ORIENTATION=-
MWNVQDSTTLTSNAALVHVCRHVVAMFYAVRVKMLVCPCVNVDALEMDVEQRLIDAAYPLSDPYLRLSHSNRKSVGPVSSGSREDSGAEWW